MADNKQLPITGTGTADVVIATDEISGVDYQKIKIIDGTAESTTAIGGDATNGLDVDVTRVQGNVTVVDGGGSLTVDGTVAVTATDLDVRNLAPGTDEVKVTGAAADGAAVSGNPVLIAGQDGTNTQSIKTDASGELQVDVLTLPALVAGTANIGDVDVLTVPAPLSTTGGGTEATAHRVTIANDSTGVLSVDDNGGSLTVDGTVTIGDGTDNVDVLAAGADNVANTENQLVTAGMNYAFDGTAWDRVPNGGGTEAAAMRVTLANDSTGVVSVDDNGASLTVDNATISVVGGGTEATAQRVTIANDSTGVLSVDDNGGALTVDATDLDIRNLTTTDEVTVKGGAASGSPAAGNPVLIAGVASDAIPTDVGADGDVVSSWMTRNGATIIAALPHLGLGDGNPFTLTSKTVQTTTTQTGSDVVTPTSGKKLVVTKVQIQVGGTTAGTMQLWFGANADTTYTRGTDLAIFDGEFAPSATLKPGVIMDGPFIASAVDHEIHLTTSAAINPLTVTVWYYEF